MSRCLSQPSKLLGWNPIGVDKDAGASVPIEAIEKGVQDAAVCLADITTDNPNVWYELGYSFAEGKPVIMVCAAVREGKKQYPFDIQHRNVTPYHSGAPDDFTALQDDITKRLKAELAKGATIRQLASSEPAVAPVDGLSQNEMGVLAILGGSVTPGISSESAWSLQQESEKAGMTKLGCNLALRKLLEHGFIAVVSEDDGQGNYYQAFRLKDSGWQWLVQNETRLQLRKRSGHTPFDDFEDFDEDGEIPF